MATPTPRSGGDGGGEPDRVPEQRDREVPEEQRVERAPADLHRLEEQERERQKHRPDDDEPDAEETGRVKRRAASAAKRRDGHDRVFYSRLASRSRAIAAAPVPSCPTVIGSGRSDENGGSGFAVTTPEPSGYS